MKRNKNDLVKRVSNLRIRVNPKLLDNSREKFRNLINKINKYESEGIKNRKWNPNENRGKLLVLDMPPYIRTFSIIICNNTYGRDKELIPLVTLSRDIYINKLHIPINTEVGVLYPSSKLKFTTRELLNKFLEQGKYSLVPIELEEKELAVIELMAIKEELRISALECEDKQSLVDELQKIVKSINDKDDKISLIKDIQVVKDDIDLRNDKIELIKLIYKTEISKYK